jgi:hypothetical protein
VVGWARSVEVVRVVEGSRLFNPVGGHRPQQHRQHDQHHGTRKLESFKAAGNVRLVARMNDPKAPRPSRQPLMDSLGQMCADGKQTAEYLWQVPKDAAARQKILDLLTQIGSESAKQGRREMPKLVEELKIAAQASPSPQQVELLVDGFDRLMKLWQAAKSGLL